MPIAKISIGNNQVSIIVEPIISGKYDPKVIEIGSGIKEAF